MARPYWSGTIRPSLVSYGVKLIDASETARDIHFRLIGLCTGGRIKQQNAAISSIKHNSDEADDPVQSSVIVKGDEYARSRYLPRSFTDGNEAAVIELVGARLKHAPVPREGPPRRIRNRPIRLMAHCASP